MSSVRYVQLYKCTEYKTEQEELPMERTHRINEPVIRIDPARALAVGLSSDDIRQWVPLHLMEPVPLVCGWWKYRLLQASQWPIQGFIKLLLRPPKDAQGGMDAEEVRRRYDDVSSKYDWLHGLTTRWADYVWRNFLAQSVVNFARAAIPRRISVLDLCCGTGLSLERMAIALYHGGLQASLQGLDYSPGMLDEAMKRRFDFPSNPIRVCFARGDAKRLLFDPERLAAERMESFFPNTFDMVTTMFGLGGIDEPLEVAEGVLGILKEGGQWFVTDMHAPLAHQPGKWPFLFWAFECPMLEAMTFRDTTIPLALRRLWRWRDTTTDFVRLPLTTWLDSEGQWWGFRVVSREVWSQPWWFFNLPVMPVAKILLEKVRISDKEAAKRQAILSLL